MLQEHVTTDYLDAGPLATRFAQATAWLADTGFADALWQRRLDIWDVDAAAQRTIANRLGWLGALDFVAPHVDRLRRAAASVRDAGFSDVVLLGMGGSSLAAEVLRQVLGVAPGYPRFQILDSIDPDAVRAAMDRAASTLFVLASKSGVTIEPNAMAAEARRRVESAGQVPWGSRFIAITDENTVLHRRAIDDGFRELFLNPPDIGGRYSALSFFGLVPAALMGIDLEPLLAAARGMEQACRRADVARNPGLALGAFMAAGASCGRDKLTLLVADRVASLGLWVEQLVAESTGKRGKGIVPITGEPDDAPFGPDRMAVAVSVGSERPPDAVLARAKAAGTPLLEIAMPDATAIGAEFLRWEVATATAGALLGINPFDEPNVQQAKEATRALLGSYAATGSLPIPHAQATIEGATLALTGAAEQGAVSRSPLAFLTLIVPGDYFALLAYLPPSDGHFAAVLQQFRAEVSRRARCATMFSYGPRYLHSTGQLHKGGGRNGVLLIVTAEPAFDLAIPGHPFSFGILERAQAIGDFQSLDRTGRRALLVHLPRRDPELLENVLHRLAMSGLPEST
jgi:glucose-6-phosphate isomerase